MANENKNSNSCNKPKDNVFGLITKFCRSISRDISDCRYENETDVPKFRSMFYELMLTKYPIDKTSTQSAKDELQKQICIAQLDMRFDDRCSDIKRIRETPIFNRYEALSQVEELLNSEDGQQLKPFDESLLFMMLILTEIESKKGIISDKVQFCDPNIPKTSFNNNLFVPRRDYEYYSNMPEVKPRPNFFEKVSIKAMKMEFEKMYKDNFGFKFPIQIKLETFEQCTTKEIPRRFIIKPETYSSFSSSSPPPSSSSSSSSSKPNNHVGLHKEEVKNQHNEDKSTTTKRSLRVLSMESAECQGTSYMRKFLSDTNLFCEVLIYTAQKKGMKLQLRRLSSIDFITNLKLATVGIQSETFIRDDKTNDFHILQNTIVNGISPMETELYVEPFLNCGKSFKILNEMVLKSNHLFDADSYVYKGLCSAIDEYLSTFRQFVMLQPNNSILSEFYITLRTFMTQLVCLQTQLCDIQNDNPDKIHKGILYLNHIYTRMRKYVKTEFITLMIFLLKRMCQVYFKYLQRWFINAILNDPFKDLFIKNVFVTNGGKNFFNKEHNIRKSAVPIFLRGTEETILNCGKYTMLLKSFKPNHPLFDIQCPQVKVCFDLKELEETRKDWTEYLEKAKVHCKIVNIQTIFAERKALKDEIKKHVMERHKVRAAEWKEQQLNEKLKRQNMINIWRKQSEEELQRKLDERQEKLAKEMYMQRELELLEEQSLVRENVNLRKRIAYLKNCRYFLHEDIVILSKTIDKDNKKHGNMLIATTKRKGLTPLGDKTNMLLSKKSSSLVDVNELNKDRGDLELLLEPKAAFKSSSCDSVFESGNTCAVYADKDNIISQAALNLTIDHDLDLNKQHQNQYQHSDSDMLNSNIEPKSICSQNRERMMSGQLMSDSLSYVRDINKSNTTPSNNKKKPLTDLERNVMTDEFHTPKDKPILSDLKRNRMRVMTEVYTTPLPQPPDTLVAMDKRILTDLERNRKRVLTEVYTTPLPQPPNTLGAMNKPILTDLERNRKRVLTEVYTVPLPQPPDTLVAMDKPILTDLEQNRNRVMTEVYTTPLPQPPDTLSTLDKPILTDLEQNRNRVMTEVYTAPLPQPSQPSDTLSTLDKPILSDLEQNRNRVMTEVYTAPLPQPSDTLVAMDKPILTDLEQNRNRVMTEVYTLPLPQPPDTLSPLDKPILTDLEQNRNRVLTEVYTAPLPQVAMDKPILTDLERNRKRVLTEVYTTPLQHSSSSITDTDINLNTLSSDNSHIHLSDLQINRLHMHHSSMIYKGSDNTGPEKNQLQNSEPRKLTQREINRKRILETEYGIRVQDVYLMEKEKQQHQKMNQNKRIIPTLQLPEQQMMNKKDDNLDADTPMSITSDISIGATSSMASHPQFLDEFNNNHNHNETMNRRNSGAFAVKSSYVLQNINEISSDNSEESIKQVKYIMSPPHLPQDYSQESEQTACEHYLHNRGHGHDHAHHHHHYHKTKVHGTNLNLTAETANAFIKLISAKFKHKYNEFCQNKNENPEQYKENPPYMNLYKLLDENFAFSNENSRLPNAILKDCRAIKDRNDDDGEKQKEITCITYEDTLMIPNILKESVMIPVRFHYKLVRNELMRILYEDTQIYEHFRHLRNYYFLMDGTFGEAITEGIIGRLENGSSPSQLLSFQILHTVLYKAINNSPTNIPKFSDNLSFEVLEIPDQFNITSPNALNMLILSYRVEWPLSLILTPEAMEHYKMIYQFLFKLRRVHYCLDHAYLYLKGPCDTKLTTSPQFRRVQFIRYKLAHFASSLQSYVHSNVLQSSWQRFKVALCKVADVEMLYQAHANYLKEIKFLCLLNRQSDNMNKQMNSILKILLRFYNVLKADKFILNPVTRVYEHKRYERLLHEERLFDDFILYFMYLGQKVVSHGYQEQIRSFICLMNLNQYYFDETEVIKKPKNSSSSHQLKLNNT